MRAGRASGAIGAAAGGRSASLYGPLYGAVMTAWIAMPLMPLYTRLATPAPVRGLVHAYLPIRTDRDTP